MYAAWYNSNPEVTLVLVAAGSDVDARGEYGWTPLMIAAWYNSNVEVTRTLIDAGHDPSDITILYLAHDRGRVAETRGRAEGLGVRLVDDPAARRRGIARALAQEALP
jgi:ankyrin repeat protein